MRHFAISAADFRISTLVLQKQHSFKHKRRFSQVYKQINHIKTSLHPNFKLWHVWTAKKRQSWHVRNITDWMVDLYSECLKCPPPVLMQASHRRLGKRVIDFLTASCGSSSHIFSNALAPRCSSVVDLDILYFSSIHPEHGNQAYLNPGCLGPDVLVNEVRDARSRRSLENNALKTKSLIIHAYFNIAERNLSYL